jgi:hypothetical protein
MNCGQCGRPAFYKASNGVLLCIDCNWKVQQIAAGEFAHNAAELNYLTEQMDYIAGLSGTPPVYIIPQPTIHTGPVTNHNIRVDNSVIGTINTGQIKNLNVALDNIQNAGSPDLASALQKLTEAVLASSELPPEQRTAAVEHLSYIANQAALPKDKRQPAIGTSILEGFERIIRVSSGLLSIWNTVKPLVERLF